ncbi:MAG: AAA family ATPase [Prevotella sp.]|jgi:RecA-family ATPase|nr:AAA family ATPase [Prevotella sp.]
MMDKIRAIEEALQPQQSTGLDDHEIDLSREYPEPKYSLMLSGVGTLPRGDIQAIKAKSKNGKSFLCTVFVASIFGCNTFSFESKENNPTVLYFDTEQNKRNTAKLARRVHTLLGWNIKENHEGFHAYSLRTMDTPERLPFIDEVITKRKPTAVFIDGIADLIENFNDVEQSTDLINHLMRLSAENDCCLCCVLHTNKGKDDSGMKGHLGTMLLQKASDVFEVKKDGSTFRVTETDCRNQPIDDFAFSIDGHGIPFPSTTIAEDKKLERLEGIKKILKECFSTSDVLNYTDLVNAYHENGAVSVPTAKRAVKDAKENDIIKLIPNEGYSMV